MELGPHMSGWSLDERRDGYFPFCSSWAFTGTRRGRLIEDGLPFQIDQCEGGRVRRGRVELLSIASSVSMTEWRRLRSGRNVS